MYVRQAPWADSSPTYVARRILKDDRRELSLTKGDGGEGSHEAHVTSRQAARYGM